MIETLGQLTTHFGAAPTLQSLNGRFQAETRPDCRIALRGADRTWLELGFDEEIPEGFRLASFDLQWIVEDEIGYDRTVNLPVSPADLDAQIQAFIGMVEYMEDPSADDDEESAHPQSRLTDHQWNVLNVMLAHVAQHVAREAGRMLDAGISRDEVRQRIIPIQTECLQAALRGAHEGIGTPREFIEPDVDRMLTHYTLRLSEAGFAFGDAIDQSYFARLEL